ncbi:MAG: hypothetical protein JXR97_02185 [Planctomycetes bacterium]|nr:hypothetical protein [Planctomycetota bacterium]
MKAKLSGIILAAIILVTSAGCSSISRETHFTPCNDPQCAKCHGTGTYKCPRCLGRGVEVCSVCNGMGSRNCTACGGCGLHKDKKCKSCDGRGHIKCPFCNGLGREECRSCHGTGLIDCGLTTYTWVCRKCGQRFDYPAKLCPVCDKDKMNK